MKPVFKCDYCSFMGTEEKVAKHEVDCRDNYDRKNCHTCQHKKGFTKYECEAGKDIPEGKMYEFCDLYERKEKPEDPLVDLFGGLFGR